MAMPSNLHIYEGLRVYIDRDMARDVYVVSVKYLLGNELLDIGQFELTKLELDLPENIKTSKKMIYEKQKQIYERAIIELAKLRLEHE